MKRKYPTIDLLKLMEQWNADLWMQFINKAVKEQDLEKLKKTLYGIQAGMDLLVRQHLSTDKIVGIFADMTRSIEIAARKIFVKKYPSPLDKGVSSSDQSAEVMLKDQLKKKRIRDREFSKFLKEARF